MLKLAHVRNFGTETRMLYALLDLLHLTLAKIHLMLVARQSFLLPSLLIQELPHQVLNLDGSQVLSGHGL